MEEGVRSGQYSGTVVKSRNSSGCLIVRKKGSGMSGVVSSGPRKVFESKKEKKRARLLLSDSGSSDELLLDPYRRRAGGGMNQVRNGSAGFHKDMVEETENFGNRNRAEHVKRKSVVGGSDELEIESKRSRLDVFEFDEYDGIDGNDMRNEYVGNGGIEVGGRRSLGLKTMSRSGSYRECESGSNRHVVKRKHSLLDGSGCLATERISNVDYFSKKRFKMKRDGPLLSDSLSRDKFGVPTDEAIRLQGKNGVLKVMINKKNKGGGPMKSFNHGKIDGDAVNGNSLVCPSSNSEMKVLKKSSSVARADKSQPSDRKPVPTKTSKPSMSDSEDSDSSLKLDRKNVKTCSSIKKVNSAEVTPPSEKLSLTSCKEGKVKRGTGTEKQLLREQIRKMLISAGWTIDYRPRRNRDYLDAVYINPSGTGYWSIVKAYDAFQKQLEDEDNNIKSSGECSFTPISEEVLSKLTRQTRRKIENEMRNKQRDSASNKHPVENNDSSDNEDKLSSFMRQTGKSLKGRLREVDYENRGNSSSNIYERAARKGRGLSSDSHLVLGRKSRKIGRCTLLVRRSKGQSSETDGFVPYTGKRTLLSWMIDSGTVQLNEKVKYMNRRRTRAMLEGWITKEGIHCGCCSKILTVSKFEIHAGSKLRQPFQNIVLESGVSLLQCQLGAWNKQEESERSGFHCVDIDGDDPNDDTCGICGDGGDLICCDSCPSTFHLSCLHIQMLPPGDWHCPNCSCKFCGVNDENFSRGNDTTAVGSLLNCSLCEKKYHEMCILKNGDLPVASSTLPTSFCGQKCWEICERLQKFLGVKHELEAGFSWSLIHRTNQDPDTSVRGFPQRVECNSKLAVALSIMDECFLPIVDRRSGINLIHNVLYNCGSNFSRLDYSGFYTAILERGDEIISAASIRIHGTQLAEMPFIGTRHIYRRQGMCRRLFCAIESALSSLKIEKLVIPAISDLMHTWTVVFGFNPLEESHKQEMRSLNMLVFPDTDMLHKILLEQEITEGKTIASPGAEATEVKGNHCRRSGLATKSDMDSFMDHKPVVCNDAAVHCVDRINHEVAPHELKAEPCSDSKSAEKVAKSTLDEKSLSSFHVGDDDLAMEKPVVDSNVEVIFQSPTNHEVKGAPAGNVIASQIEPVPDCLGEICAENAAEDIPKETNLICVPVSTIYNADESKVQFYSVSDSQNASEMEIKSTIYNADESKVQCYSDSDSRNALEMEIKSHVASQASSEATPGEECACTTEILAEDTNQIVQCDSAPHNMEVIMAEINQNSDTPREVKICSEGNICSYQSGEKEAESASDGKFSSIGVADDVLEVAKIVPDIEGAIQSPANHEVRDVTEGNAEAACIEPVLAFTTENISVETNQSDVPGSNFHSMNESTLEVKEISRCVISVPASSSADEPSVPLNSNLHRQTATRYEESIPYEKIAEDTDQMVPPDSTSHNVEESMVQLKETNQNSMSVSTIHSADEVTARSSYDLHYQNASVLENEAHVASQASFDATDCKESIRSDARELKIESASA